ncbi:L-fucose isomerase [Nocardia amikacinitolerans]|nr:L-fucose/L-arabinose isomerase family protein [Nocardia amikacinitolerans]MCP2293862.1 L-fucose isomerase [Nocardia amikacinitolerans]
MARIGVISVSDGRDYVHTGIADFIRTTEDRLVAALTAAGHEVVRGTDIISDNALAGSVAREVAAAGVDLTVLHYAVWAFPHFSMLAAGATPGPLLLLSNIDPVQPGMVGMLAAGGALDQVGRAHTRLWGDPEDAALIEAIGVRATAAAAVSALRGSTFGRFGGRPMGMNTAVANTDQWQRLFGIDVEEIDQWEIVRRAEQADAGEAKAAREWLERHATVHYDGAKLTPELLERQIRSYLAVRELIAQWRLDFSGIKGQPELTQYFATMDVTEAFLNDPYDWNGPKQTHVCATEADMDGALTMQLLKHLAKTPVLFADVRHYHADRDIWDLCNSGQHATWFAARSADPAEPRQGAPLPGGVLLPGGRRVGASSRRAGHDDSGQADPRGRRLSDAADARRVRDLRRADQRIADETVHQGVAARVRPARRARRGLPVPLRRQPHSRRAGRPPCGGACDL